jgi:thiamine-monophosphate kinase
VTFKDSDHLGEFDVIRRYCMREGWSPLGASHQPANNPQVLLSIGDDCALLGNLPKGEVLAITSDMLVENRHFFKDTNPRLLGHKCLAVNLSDLAAMGARPLAYSLSIALPEIRPTWLEEFASGLHAIGDHYGVTLLGGDTTAGPLTISITAYGSVAPEKALRRNAAKVGDDIWVSGSLGDARLILGIRRGEWQLDLPWEFYSHRMDAPTPRVELGLGLSGLANSAIDISDGLLGDLSHILKASQVGANVSIDTVPHSPLLGDVSLELRRLCTLRGGDDYELCFTANPEKRHAIEALSTELDLGLCKIGSIRESGDHLLSLFDHDGHPLPAELTNQYIRSFDHFQEGA